MQDPGDWPGQWINVSGSGNNVAVGAGARAGNSTVGSQGGADVATLLAQIRSLAEGTPDRAAGEQTHAAATAIEADLAKPHTHRFSISGALAALSSLGERIPQLTQLVDALTKAIHSM
jgi:hypothetical protein